MPHSYPRPNPPSPYIPRASQRPSLSSIASSSVYLTPVQEQRILSWRVHAAPPSPLSSSALAPTPALTASASPTTGTGSHSSGAMQAPPPPHTPQPTVPRNKVKSAPASLLTPSGGSQCKACGGSCRGCSTVSRATHPPHMPPISNQSRPMIHPLPPHHISSMVDANPPSSGSGTGMSRQRSYYSTKKYRQARAMALREQSGYGSGTGMTSGSGSGSGSGLNGGGGQDPRGMGREGMPYAAAQNEPANQLPPGSQPEWGGPDGETSQREPPRVFVQADPVINPTPRIGGARDPVTQQYWRNMFPPAVGPKGINSGLPIPVMGMGMSPTPMFGMPGMMPFL